MIGGRQSGHVHGKMTAMKIYDAILRKSQHGRQRHHVETARVAEWHHTTPGAAWAAHVASSLSRDPADYFIVGIVLTGEINDNGAHVGHYDWSDVHDPQALPEVLAAERARAAD